jgi:hypothetical protein
MVEKLTTTTTTEQEGKMKGWISALCLMVLMVSGEKTGASIKGHESERVPNYLLYTITNRFGLILVYC